MVIASSMDGSSTCTGVNRRSNAPSFSIYFLYSSIVVAPITCKSPRASKGFKIFAASIELSADAPAPTMVWISSINKSTSPSFNTASTKSFNLSSKSPRYLAPAIIPGISTENNRLLRSCSGTLPSTIKFASPSTIALLPTPGSPIKTGLFFERRDSTCVTFSTSFFLPTTGSILPCRARSVKSIPYGNDFSSFFFEI